MRERVGGGGGALISKKSTGRHFWMGSVTKSLIRSALCKPCTSSMKMMIAITSMVSVASSRHHPKKFPISWFSPVRLSRVSIKAKPQDMYRRIDVMEAQSRRSNVLCRKKQSSGLYKYELQ